MTQHLIANCIFAFTCHRRWDALALTGNPDIRHCDQCARDVHLCRNEKDFRHHARAGRCIAVPLTLPGKPPAFIVGRPGSTRSLLRDD